MRNKMFCTNCGAEMADNATICTKCGVAKGTEKKFCYNCGTEITPNQAICVKCGVAIAGAPKADLPAGIASPAEANAKSRMTAALLAIFLGTWGIHKFYLGKKKPALIMLIISIVGALLSLVGIGLLALGAMNVIGFIEGIIYLLKSDADFEALYVKGNKDWF